LDAFDFVRGYGETLSFIEIFGYKYAVEDIWPGETVFLDDQIKDCPN
tara:strand:+ start:19 stop:159 length:141 start_codon:yes stop_codon:yes gene_type:complete